MVRAIIFDYDGLLADTEGLWFEARKKLLKEDYGIDLQEELRGEIMRGHVSQYLIEKLNVPETPQILRKKASVIFEELTKEGLRPMLGALEIVRRVSLKYPLGIASGSSASRVRKSLQGFGIESYFKTVIGGDDVKKSKPDPECYLKAAEALGIPPRECLAFEDQPMGLAAAKKAGMKCIVIPSKYLQGADYSSADAVIESLELVTNDVIENLD